MDPDSLHYYQLRYDSWNPDYFIKKQANYLNILGYVYGLEKKADGTKHIQAFIINEFKLTQNEKTKIRLSIKTQLKHEYKLQDDNPFLKNSVAISDAKYPHALMNYCSKTSESVTENLTPLIKGYIKSLPLNNKNQFKDLLSNYIVQLQKKPLTRAQFYTEICQFYILHDRSLPRKQQLLTLAVKYNYMEFSQYLEEINLVYCSDHQCPHCCEEEGEITNDPHS